MLPLILPLASGSFFYTEIQTTTHDIDFSKSLEQNLC